jgi:hypothetical protein
MIWIVIATQLLLSAGLLWASWQMWMLRSALKATVKTVDGWTEACENSLEVSTPSLEVARGGVDTTRKQYQLLQDQVEKIRQLLSILARGVSFVGSRWQQSRKNMKGSTSNSSSNKSRSGRASGSKHNVKRRR